MRERDPVGIGLLLGGLLLGAVSCGGGGGGDGDTDGTGQQISTFTGGSLEDLKALAADLHFDKLVMSGALVLAPYENLTLSVNDLVIEPTGAIRYTYGECEYAPAPDITINAAASVDIDGEIALRGRSGTRVLDSATCNSCYGQDGGAVTITAGGALSVGSSVITDGGNGGTSVSSWGSSGCSGGDAGPISLRGASLDLTGAALSSDAGNGGVGYLDGTENSGSDGVAGRIDLETAGLLAMAGGSASTDGDVNLQADSTAIYGAITAGGAFNDAIGGATDTTPPHLAVNAPVADTALPFDQPVAVSILVNDEGSGLKEIQITGLGHDQIHPGGEAATGTLAFQIPEPQMSDTFRVVATDNKGQSSSVDITGVTLTGNLHIPVGESYTVEGDLLYGPGVTLSVEGTLVLTRLVLQDASETALVSAVAHTFNVGSVAVSGTGRIELDHPTTCFHLSTSPSLRLLAAGPASIAGTIDLTGRNAGEGLLAYDYCGGSGEDGGDLYLSAESIDVPGVIRLDGGDTVDAAGSNGGQATLTASAAGVALSGTLSSRGGDAANSSTSTCHLPGDGGTVYLQHATTAPLGGTIALEGGTYPVGDPCGAANGTPGWLLANYLGAPDPVNHAEVAEQEPNSAYDTLNEGQFLAAPVRISGTITPADQGDLYIDVSAGEDIEDFYKLGLEVDQTVTVTLTWSDGATDLDLHVFDAATYSMLGTSGAGPGVTTEAIDALTLTAGNYLIGVDYWGTTPGTEIAYTLTVTPAAP